MDASVLRRLARRYTEAWCSQDASRVASFFSPKGSLAINGGVAAVGRAAITEAAQGFMTAFPDLSVAMDELEDGSIGVGRAVYRWTLTGTDNGPLGRGNALKISGFEVWRFGADGLIAESLGYFDGEDFQRQLRAGSKE